MGPSVPIAVALILAAGVGRRLSEAPAHRGKPKSLLEFDGVSLMARHLEALRQQGVTDITVVAGFEAEALRAVLDGQPGVTVVLNPDFREGSVVSLWAGRAVLRSGTPGGADGCGRVVRRSVDGPAARQQTPGLPVAGPRD